MRVSSETTEIYTCLFSIACKINLGLVKNNGNPGGTGVFGLGNPGGRGVKNLAICRGGGWIYSGITHLQFIKF